MTFKDYFGNKICLSPEVWENHIQINHPEIDLLSIEITLSTPDEVWLSQHRTDTELFYKKRIYLVLEKRDTGWYLLKKLTMNVIFRLQ